jgi:hypothetical protein
MDEAPTTVIIQRYLDALPGDAAEPVVRELLERAVGRLRQIGPTGIDVASDNFIVNLARAGRRTRAQRLESRQQAARQRIERASENRTAK